MKTDKYKTDHDEDNAVCLTEELIESFLLYLEENGRKGDTIVKYRRDLNSMYRFLPDDKMMDSESLIKWRDSMLSENMAPRTVNSCVSVINSFYQYIGRRNWQAKQIKEDKSIQPEITRSEYLRLLQTAKQLGKERLYLMVKVFGCTGISVSELKLITAEALMDEVRDSKSNRIHIPECLRNDLINFAMKEGVRSGPIFITRGGLPIDRVSVCNSMKQLCMDAHVPEEKVNPRCLKKMYEDTYAGIRSSIDILVEQAYDKLIENEQLTVGWDF